MNKQTIIDKFLEDKDLQEHELVYWKHKVSNGFKLKKFMEDFIDYYNEQLRLGVVGISCVKEKKLIEELDDKRIVGVKLTDDMWYYSRKETAQHLLDKYEIKPK